MSGEAIVEARDLRVSFGARKARTQVLNDVGFDIARGESVGLIGETGSGKSTLARAVVGLVRPDQGSVRIDGQQVTDFSSAQWREFRRSGTVQYVFQDPLRALDPDIKIGESLAEPLLLTAQRRSRSEIRDIAAESLAKVRLGADLLDRFPSELSGGQRQRVLLARALTTEPRVLILDEPVSALDAANRVAVLEILLGLRASGTSLLFISHDLGSVAGVTDRVLVLYRGDLVEEGPTRDVVRTPAHPYTRLLIGSAPTLHGGAIDRERRHELRALLEAS